MSSSRCLSAIALVLLALSIATPAPGSAPDHSSIGFTASNLFSTARGTFHSWRVTNSSVSLEDLARSFVEVEVDLSSVDTGIERRDDHLRDPDFFEVETYPVANVRAHSIERETTDGSGPARYTAKFDVDLHGVRRTLEGSFVVASESPFTVEGSIVLNRLDFGVGGPESIWNPMSITEEVPVSFRLTLP
jgi:polyisoprenoid-binding protein YceI